ncbi:CYTH domain-containing protein [Cyanobium sp. NIES-981]|uniref:CYTH domain-containing protein n=1 Tax=Cyanobium sp. NIES-981 TaxID=1851505 RepID=UPI0007DDF2B4|nr:CYTH domain-containing protein [Cyanobium sp. NIES-981]SBO44855.1 Adenylate cyclase [Cyanobium sp. NIES-981]
MGLEIERRFLVDGDGWQPHVCWRARLDQGYLVARPDGMTLRVRRTVFDTPGASDGAWLTLKARPPQSMPAAPAREGIVRQEFEYAIPAEDALALMAMASERISKWRHGLDLPGGAWVVDVFEGENAPLVVAEVELESHDQHVSVPCWCREEVTGRHELSNAALARQPLLRWSSLQRARLPAWFAVPPVASDTIS